VEGKGKNKKCGSIDWRKEEREKEVCMQENKRCKKINIII